MNRRGVLVWAVAVAAMLFTALACNQGSDDPTPITGNSAEPGGIAGTVTDLDRRPLVRMRVSIVSGTATFPEIAPETDEGGSYQINNVPSGTFEVGVQDRDGQQIGLESVVVNSGETAPRNFSVSIGAATQDQPVLAASPISTSINTKELTKGLCLPAGPLAVEVGDSWTMSGLVSIPVDFPTELPEGAAEMSSTFTVDAIETATYVAGRGSTPIKHPSVELQVKIVTLDANGTVLSTEDSPGSWVPASVGNLGPVLTLDWECHRKSWLRGWSPDAHPSVSERTLSSGVTAVVFSVTQPLVIPDQGIEATMERHHGYDKATGRVVLQEGRATGTTDGNPFSMEMLQELEITGAIAVPLGTGSGACQKELELQVSLDESEAGELVVVTSYQCMNMYVDSTGQLPSRSSLLRVPRGVSLSFRLGSEQVPSALDIRLYPGAGVSGYFFSWPEELSSAISYMDRPQPAPSPTLQYLPQQPPGEYSLVIKATWDGPIVVFYAIGLTLE